MLRCVSVGAFLSAIDVASGRGTDAPDQTSMIPPAHTSEASGCSNRRGEGCAINGDGVCRLVRPGVRTCAPFDSRRVGPAGGAWSVYTPPALAQPQKPTRTRRRVFVPQHNVTMNEPPPPFSTDGRWLDRSGTGPDGPPVDSAHQTWRWWWLGQGETGANCPVERGSEISAFPLLRVRPVPAVHAPPHSVSRWLYLRKVSA